LSGPFVGDRIDYRWPHQSQFTRSVRPGGPRTNFSGTDDQPMQGHNRRGGWTMKTRLLFVASVLAMPVAARDLPKANLDGEKALEELSQQCAEAGGITYKKNPKGGADLPVLADPAKVRKTVAVN